MDRNEARTILLAYRPGTSDGNDPRVAEALDLTKRDPELARWLDEQNAFFAAVRTKLKDAPVPANLKQQILAGRKIIRPVIWWKNPTLLAAAAMLLLLVGVAAVFLNAQHTSGFSAYRTQMVKLVEHEYKKDVEVESLAELQDVFRKKQWPFDYVVPEALQAVPLEGGTALDWKGHKVSMLCFETREEKDIWLFVTDRANVPDAPADQTPQFSKVRGLYTISWSIGGKTYLLTGEVSEEALKKLL